MRRTSGNCPICGSDDIDRERRECRACKTGLPAGSYDVYYPSKLRRSIRRSDQSRALKVHSDKSTESIIGGNPL